MKAICLSLIFVSSLIAENQGELLIAGIKYRSEGKYEDAVRIFTKMIKFNPEDPVVYYQLGMLYAQIGKYSVAEFNLKRALQLKPDWLEVKYELKMASVKLQEYAQNKDSLEVFEMILEEESALDTLQKSNQTTKK